MRFCTSNQLLEQTRSFHSQASGYYKTLAKTQHKEKMQFLLGYLAKHEAQLADSIARYQQDAKPGILGAWFDDAPDINFSDALKSLDVQENPDIDDIIRTGMHLADYLIWAYETLADQAETEDVKEAFQNLALMTMADKRTLAWNSNALFDV